MMLSEITINGQTFARSQVKGLKWERAAVELEPDSEDGLYGVRRFMPAPFATLTVTLKDGQTFSEILQVAPFNTEAE